MDFADKFPMKPVSEWVDAHGLDVFDSEYDRDADYVSHEAMHRLFLRLQKLGYDETVGLELGALCGLDTLGLFGQLGQHCGTLGEAADVYMRYRTMSETPETYVEMGASQEDVTIFVAEPLDASLLSSQSFRLAFSFSQTMAIFREIFEDSDVTLSSLHFRSRDSRYQSVYEAYFRCPVTFAAPKSAISFDAALLHRPIPRAVPATRPFLEEMARLQIESNKKSRGIQDGFLEQLKEELRETTLSGGVDVEVLARRLQISTRTLQRRLADKNLTFRDVAKEVLQEVAYDMLLHSGLSIQEIAFKLGYSQASSFTRAFKRWTGISPSEIRGDGVG